jgi:hypothetical protein
VNKEEAFGVMNIADAEPKVSGQPFLRGCCINIDVCHHLIGGQQDGVLM